MKSFRISCIMLIPAVIFLLLTNYGCSEFQKIHSRTDLLSVKIDSASSQIDSISNQIHELNRKIAVQIELQRLYRADIQVQTDMIKSMMDSLTAKNASDTFITDTSENIAPNWRQRMKADSISRQNHIMESRSLFNLATADFNAGRRSVAQAGFEDILRRYSNTPSAEESLYWLGECLYSQKMKTEAGKKYKEYIDLYPFGAKICPALFKLGLIYHSEKAVALRDEIWGILITNFPHSEEARIAQSRIKTEK